MDIYDKAKGRWYFIERGIWGLRLNEIDYRHIVRAPVNGDLIFEDDKLTLFHLPEPKIPSPFNSSKPTGKEQQ